MRTLRFLIGTVWALLFNQQLSLLPRDPNAVEELPIKLMALVYQCRNQEEFKSPLPVMIRRWLSIFMPRSFVASICFACCFAPWLCAQVAPLSFHPISASYSSALDRIIMISANPNVLHIHDPATHQDVSVTLPDTPSSLSVSPDGLHAAVGLSSETLYVDLQSATIANTFSVAAGQAEVLLAATHLYVVPTYDGTFTDIDLSTNQTRSSSLPIEGASLNPVNGQIYTISPNAPPDLSRLNPPGSETWESSWPYFFSSKYSICGPIWFSPDGTRMYTACGTILKSSTDASADMRYIATIKTPQSILTFAESAALGRIAYVMNTAYSNQPSLDTTVNVLDSTYLSPTATFTLTPFSNGPSTFPSHGRWVFFNADSSKLYVVTEADPKAGLSNPFAIEALSLQSPPECTATIDTPAITDEGDGGYYTVHVTAGTGCTFGASTSAAWVTLASPHSGSGNLSLTFEVQRNGTGQTRNTTVSVAGQAINITQHAPGNQPSTPLPLSFNVVASDYDKPLARFVIAASTPNELHLFDPATTSDNVVQLALPPLSISIGPDGTHALVGHDGWISYVDLTNLRVLNVFPVGVIANVIVLDASGKAYVFENGFASSSSKTVNLTNGGLSAGPFVSGPVMSARLSPSARSLYVESQGVTLQRFDLPTATLQDSATIGQYYNCDSGFWFGADSSHMFTGCSDVRTVSDSVGQDLMRTAPLPTTDGIVWADESTTAGLIAVVPGNEGSYNGTNDTQLQFYSNNNFNLSSQLMLPPFVVAGKSYRAHGQAAIWSADSSKVFVLEEADSSALLTNVFALAAINGPAHLPGCSYNVDTTPIVIGPNTTLLPIPVTANCSWTYTTDAYWLSPSSSTIGPNISTSEFIGSIGSTLRTGNIIVFGNKIPITEDPASCQFSFSPSSVHTLFADAATLTLTVDVGAGCGWTAYSQSPWITVAEGASGSGTGSVIVNVAPNATGYSRSGSVTIGGSIFLITQAAQTEPAADPDTALEYVPVTPCRVADTRNPDGPFGGPILVGGTSRDFSIPASACGIPPTAQAYMFNVTVVPSGPLSYLTVSPSGGTRPLVSTLNSDGRIKANAAIVPAGTAGAVNVFATDDTHVVLDISGYFVPAGIDNSALTFFPLSPCRVVDTRGAADLTGGPFLSAGVKRSFPIGFCGGLPPATYSLNFTVVPHDPLSYLTAWAFGQTEPLVSTLNAPGGTVTANAAIVSTGDQGYINVFATDDTDVVIDTSGYFDRPSSYFNTPSSGSGLSFHAITPCRAVDTREGNGPLNGTASFDVGSPCGIPSTAKAVVLNATVVPHGSLSFLTLWPTEQPKPSVSTLNAQDGATTSNMAIVPVSANMLNAFSTSSTALILDVFGYFAP